MSSFAGSWVSRLSLKHSCDPSLRLSMVSKRRYGKGNTEEGSCNVPDCKNTTEESYLKQTC